MTMQDLEFPDAIVYIPILSCVFLVVALSSYIRKSGIQYPANLPRIRDIGKTRFSLRTRLAYYTDCSNLYHEAYNTVSAERKF
jgi:hypothetical protein